jgi:hypothetical protein
MIKHLKLKEEEKITVDTLANILYQLLASNIIDDSNLWLRVNCLFSEIIQLSTSDIDYCEHRRQLDIN